MFKSFLYALSELFVCLFLQNCMYLFTILFSMLVWFALFLFCVCSVFFFGREGRGVRGGLPVFEPSVVFN